MNPMSQSEKLELLKLLTSLRAKNRCKVLKLLDDNSVNFICECVFNVCFTDLKLSRNKRKKLKSKLKSQEKVLRYLARKDNSVKNRRKKLVQSGGYIGTLLSIAIPVLTSIFSSLSSKNERKNI